MSADKDSSHDGDFSSATDVDPLTPKVTADDEDVEVIMEDEEVDSLLDVESIAQSGLDMSYRRMGFRRYKPALKSLIPIRTAKRPKDEMPVASAGLFSLITYAWLTPIMWKIYKKGVKSIENLRCPDLDRAEVNGERLERLWREELKKKGPDKASFGRVMLRACFTRVLMGGLTFIASVTFSFAAPAFVLNRLLRELSGGHLDIGFGIALVIGISVMEFCRSMCFALGWVLNYTTGVRMRGAALSMLYTKILRLRGLKNKTVGELVNLCSNDAQRLFDACSIGPLLIGGPFILACGIIYSVFLIGPWALVGGAVYLLFYPFMYFISRLTAYLRRKGMIITDKRVRMMSELLTCIKLIKMYAWEKPFAKKIAGIRAEERRVLEKAAFVSSISTSSAPMVPVMATVFVVLSHLLTGNDLSAAQAFTLIGIFNAMQAALGGIPHAIRSLVDARVALFRIQAFTLVGMYTAMRFPMGIIPYSTRAMADALVAVKRWEAFTLIALYNSMRFALGVIPYAVRAMADVTVAVNRCQAFTLVSIYNAMRHPLGSVPYAVRFVSETKIACERIMSVLMMEEIKPHKGQITNPNHSIVIKKGTFSWDAEIKDADIVTKGVDAEIKVSIPNGKSADDKNVKDEEKQRLQDNGADKSNTDSDSLPTLFDIDFTLEKGKLIGLCGSVGCGKSSMISAVLGRMVLVSGKVAVKGSVAYVAQQAWIMNATVRENILFGQVYDEDRYNQVVEACCLLEDFDAFVTGDLTEIGERGINLSGGQKQRISIARAVYADKDVYLLDDPLSAVDIHIGRHIFTNCIMKLLKGKKTVLFVTHQLQYLSQCDGILVMTDGSITERGKHEDLMAGKGEYSNLITRYYTQEKEEEEERKEEEYRERIGSASGSVRKRTFSNASSQSGKGSGKPNGLERQFSAMSANSNATTEGENKSAGRLIVAEEKSKGKVTAGVYWNYVQSAGGIIISFIVFMIFVLSVGIQAGTSWWLSFWLNQGSGNTSIVIVNTSVIDYGIQDNLNNTSIDVVFGNMTVISNNIRDNPKMRFYSLIYGVGVGVILFGVILRAFAYMKATLRASSTMHDSIFEKVLSCPMKFFDTTPVGRIINRFSADMDEIDVRLPGVSEIFIMNMLLIAFAIATICYVSPWFLIALLPLTVVFVLLNVLFTSGVRELKRLDATTRSPVLSHVTASIQGISTIHAFGKSEEFTHKFHNLLDTNLVPFFMFYSSNRWLAIRLDFLSVIVIGIVGLLVIFTYEQLTPAMAGMAMAFAIQLTGLFQFTIRLAIETEARFISVERLQHYSKEEESEAPAIIKSNRPPADWPTDGCVTFKKYKLRYREGLPLALKGVSFDVLPQEKIGIVGRSGSGKSSLGVGLFRLVEADSGSIEIDGIDISKIGLEDLRSKIAIIPQDPVLFVGTVRYNLDPFQQHNDDALWDALEKCHIKETIYALDKQLDSNVIENGENFSVGERQLMCLARALLRHSKILMLDEATAAIDTDTDALVQTTIKEAFKDCTMLIIAHRLNTVLNCNRILVMEEGKVVEFDTPSSLLSKPKSKFKVMYDASESHHGIL